MRWLWLFLACNEALAQESAREPMRNSVDAQKAASVRQRESIRKQAENMGVWLPPGGAAAAPSEVDSSSQAVVAPATSNSSCDVLADTIVEPLIAGAAKSHSLEPRLLRAVISQESGFRPCAVSRKGAQGLMQLMPATAGDLGVKDPFDPRESIEGGAKYLKQLLDRYKGDLSRALGAYNAGPGNVDDAGGVPDIPETRDYVRAILARLGQTRADTPIPPPKPVEQ
jgi:soluble lytic murein transglycosylase-like protein